MMKTLPLGRSSFEALRARNEIYVDKTAFIGELAESSAQVFLTRPRRFGKSLLVTTFESLFKHSLRDFEGLAIGKRWHDHTYPVVRLDFSESSEFENAAAFRQTFHAQLEIAFSKVGFEPKPDHDGTMRQLSSWFASLAPKSLVILIDEYDAPLTKCLTNRALFDEVLAAMNEFFLTLSSNVGCLRFFFVTGITRLGSKRLFSAFEDLQDISLDPHYGTLLGLTEEELKQYFSDYLDQAADALQIDRETVLEGLKANYGGYCFDEKALHRVYCPWSVLSFLKRPDRGFQNHLFVSGGNPWILGRYFPHHDFPKPIVFGEKKVVRLSELRTTCAQEDVSLDVLLTQSGYYTICGITEDEHALLAYPNQDVSVSMAKLYADELIKGRSIQFPNTTPIRQALEEGDVAAVLANFNAAIAAIDDQNYPITDEASCRVYLQVLLIGAAMIPKVETHNALGRSDMEVEVGKRRWVFEFKFARTTAEAAALLTKAVKQMEMKQYGTNVLADEQTLIRVALVFDASARRFSEWQCV